MEKDIAVKYNQKNARLGLIIGIILLTLDIFSLAMGNDILVFPFALAIVYIAMYFYKRRFFYLYSKDGYLKKDFGKKIRIADITETRRFAGDYIFKSKEASITIDKNMVDKESIDDIENLINWLRAKKENESSVVNSL